MSKKFAFTLAEVLITLGIIGVVASMTIPTLVANYNQRAWDTGAVVFNRKLEEALKTMNTQMTLAGHTTTESFVEELSKHFKTNKICQNDELLDCFSDVVYWGGGEATPEEVDMNEIKKAKNFGQDDWDTNIVGVLFANGVSALIAYNPTTGENSCTQDPYSNQITGGDCLAILYDTSANKNPNTSGKDLRANGNVKKLGGKACAFELAGICFGAPFLPTAISKAECEAIKSTHGIKECPFDDDYWAGAVKKCGGINKMPTMAQVAEIANYIYGTTDIGAMTDKTNITVDKTKAMSLGFTFDTYNSFYVWSNEESTTLAYLRTFSPAQSFYYTNSRGFGFQHAICLGD